MWCFKKKYLHLLCFFLTFFFCVLFIYFFIKQNASKSKAENLIKNKPAKISIDHIDNFENSNVKIDNQKKYIAKPNSIIGNKKIAIILISFKNDFEPPSKEEIEKAFEKTSKFFRENSFNKLFLKADVFGYYYSDKERPDDLNQKIQEALQISQKDIDLNKYDAVSIMHSSRDILGITAYQISFDFEPQEIKAKKGTIFDAVLFPIRFQILAHELGHVFGAHHANGWDCDARAINSYTMCQNNEYENVFDIMGNIAAWSEKDMAPHFGAYYKKLFGWFDNKNITIARKSGRYTIYPLEEKSDKTQLLQVNIPNSQVSYFIENRESIGYDTNSFGVQSPGAIIYLAPYPYTKNTELIDTNPSSDIEEFVNDFIDAMLYPGQSFTDINGLIIKTISDNNQQLIVDITLPTISPTPIIHGFTNLKSNLSDNQAVFSFSYPETFPFKSSAYDNFTIDLSEDKEFSKVWWNFTGGVNNQLVENNPKKWNEYRCGKTFFWQISNLERDIKSPTQRTDVVCEQDGR